MPKNKVLFTSGTGVQPSREPDELGHGVFSYYLIKGLRGDAPETGNDSFVSLEELELYVRERVYDYTDQKQLPRVWEHQGAPYPDLPLALRR
jgi:uncharacterized caspase-like protein